MKHQFKTFFTLLVCLLYTVSCHQADNEILSYRFNGVSNKQLQKQLDYLITHRGVQQQERLAREEYFKVRMRNSPSLRLKGLYVDSLYHLYMLHNPDSALYYEEMCLDIAQELHDTTWIISCMLGQYKTYSNITRFYEADDVHHAINKLPINDSLNICRCVEAYHRSYLEGIMCAGLPLQDSLFTISQKQYLREAEKIIRPQHPLYYSTLALNARFTGYQRIDEVLRHLETSQGETHEDAIEYRMAALYYQSQAKKEEAFRCNLISALIDTRLGCYYHAGGILGLIEYMRETGDIRHAYLYYDYVQACANEYGSPNYLYQLNYSFDNVRASFMNYIEKAHHRTRIYLGISVLFALAILWVCYVVYRQREHLRHIRWELLRKNEELESLLEELRERNIDLQESNTAKEEYIALAFGICSDYIDKQEKFRSTINSRIVTKRFSEAREMLDTSTLEKDELRKFFHRFDEVFLLIYPNFIEQLNDLLRPEGRIVPPKSKLMNTELRICALIRLGIKDSKRIAEFLHCSPQTVYNNRQHIRSSAALPAQEFMRAFENLGR